MSIKHQKQAAKRQRTNAETNIVRLETSKQDVFDHWKKCRAIFPVRQDVEVVEQ